MKHESIHICNPHKPWDRPKFAKEYAFFDAKKNKKSPCFKKNKTLPFYNPTDKNEITEQIENIHHVV